MSTLRRKQSLVGGAPTTADFSGTTAAPILSTTNSERVHQRSLLSTRNLLLAIVTGGLMLVVSNQLEKAMGIQTPTQQYAVIDSPRLRPTPKTKAKLSPEEFEKLYQTTAKLSPEEIAKLSQTIDYGIELGYILPMEVLEEANRTNSFNINANRSFYELLQTLQQQSIKVGILGHRERAPPGTWNINPERAGCEIASYLSPPRESIIQLMKGMNESHYQIDAEMTAMHINVDAQNRTKEQVRNVFKNFVAIERAFETMQTSTRVSVSGMALSVGKKYQSTVLAYQAMEDPLTFPYPAWNLRTLPNGTIITTARRDTRPVLGLTAKKTSNATKTIEFRGIQMSLDPEIAWAWVQFARKFVALSYGGLVLPPLERTPDEQWEALFGTLIQDKRLETIFRRWRADMLIPNPNRDAIISMTCHFMPESLCASATRGLRKRKRREKQRERHAKARARMNETA